ncbi:[protein-PII] uridylyltransferase [Vespertiliibacter pulmonis]|uniref:Bifunctional uridylyltransferase/uridylyl-removing enzyme n=1 Tax=Vespertiliibacter pulmonis TaxID=1443036 RepID=A0A3N4VS03_9PAST|nr:bifunctional uridylyltransferase/uridylyl-removing protein GlnD [Vespertiliibacter pulmonis]QLB21460.1 [protein-PII] uridylyltransferase [Vespertiliibacter pulmonis]RPE85876.1 UTP--GlnB (protein PII) uridylyltransferase GlnD [Vespertiliibacter pulmonis]
MNTAPLKTQILAFTEQQKADFPRTDIITLLHQRSDFYDDKLRQLWKKYGLGDRSDLCLIAVGGYGRREMFPLSDLDILILCETPIDEVTHQTIQTFLNTLWDSKLQIGSAIRTLDECVQIGKTEISVATNLFESRFLYGNEALLQQLLTRLYQPDFWAIYDFFSAKIRERKTQYARYHNTSYNLEPDLKHSPGGLRDLHLISWIMLRQYRVYSLDQLLKKGILFPEEFEELLQAQAVLFRMRFALHLQLKRYDNRLRFDRQLQLSEQLGYQGSGNQPVEAMMKIFFQATQSISQLSQLLLENFKLEWLTEPQKNKGKQPLDSLFFIRNHTLFCTNSRIFNLHPEKILDLFLHLTQQPDITPSPQLLRQIRLVLRKLKRPLCEIPEAREKFIQIFQQPQMVQRAIVPMHQLGVLSAYLPQWQHISGLMQFDMFHIYTVDEHSVRVMLTLEQFLNIENQEKFPLGYKLFPTIEQRPLIYLAALFHDIGKGKSGDHAQLGAIEMKNFAQLHGFSSQQADYMAWLVAEHLTMSITAQRRDIHDPQIINTFAHTVKTPTALSALTCLTIADIYATNETLWNDWKRSLFEKLFQLTQAQLTLGKEKIFDYQKLGIENQQQATVEIKARLSAEQQKIITDFWQSCPTRYFVQHTPTQLVWHAINYAENSMLPIVLISNQFARGATEIFIHCTDRPQFFVSLATILSAKKVSIHDAQVLTTDSGLVLDSFIITELNGEPLNDYRQQQIQQAILKFLTNDKQLTFQTLKHAHKHRSFSRKTTIRFLTNSQPNQTAFELFTLDREGLLAQIGYIFSQQNLTLLNAKITTIGEQVEDFFTVTNANQTALTDKEKMVLEKQILAKLEK